VRAPFPLMVVPLVVAVVLTTGCAGSTDGPPSDAPSGSTTPVPERLRVEVLEVLPHDPTSFTQGFELVDGVLYEGTGLVGSSAMLATDPATGAVTRRVPLDTVFGEGITVVGDRIWQLTWQDQVAIERDRATLAELRRVPYTGEGWGLCHDGRRLVMSDGSDVLTFRDPSSFEKTGEVRVRPAGEPVGQLNELECAGGSVWANVWQTDRILRIDPSSGAVTAVVDATDLLADNTDRPQLGQTDVLNGIAALPGGEEFLVTGKWWPNTFRVRFVPS
jgi:glutaminyl-peptide cyclotransferase